MDSICDVILTYRLSYCFYIKRKHYYTSVGKNGLISKDMKIFGFCLSIVLYHSCIVTQKQYAITIVRIVTFLLFQTSYLWVSNFYLLFFNRYSTDKPLFKSQSYRVDNYG